MNTTNSDALCCHEGGFGVSWVAGLANFRPRVSDLRLNRAGFRVLICVVGWGTLGTRLSQERKLRSSFLAQFSFLGESGTQSRVKGLTIFCSRVSGIPLKIPFLPGFRSHTVHVVN